ncbi:OsmC family protein [Crenobacter cavernae]|uniref:OsmC family peroxiredoxin n=1 Tax=Crenobacter cavernae TaxID=2290923 RepID=A0A345Y8Q7_9NEIS|nr:OsmC family protein [Crenobacter cavernae]AXK40309.1 OsmC family peroxiredoxin [Crenobacter cavernae]
MAEEVIRLTLSQRQDYRFDTRFDDGLSLLADEPPPLGAGSGPSPTQLLLASVANCLTASLLFALRKHHEPEAPLLAEAECEVDRNERGRLRVTGIAVTLRLGLPATDYGKLERILASFEDFCTVSQSVAVGIPMRTTVIDSLGAVLKTANES